MEQKSLLLILHVCKSIEGRKEIDTILNKNGRYHLYFLKSSKTEFHCPSLFAQLPKDKKNLKTIILKESKNKRRFCFQESALLSTKLNSLYVTHMCMPMCACARQPTAGFL